MRAYNLNTVSGRASKLYNDARNGLGNAQERKAFDAAKANNKRSTLWGLCMALAHKGRTTWSNVAEGAAKQLEKLIKATGLALAGGAWAIALNKFKVSINPVPSSSPAKKSWQKKSWGTKAIGNGPSGWCDLCQSHCFGDCRSN
jgi:hypothetical protein